MPTHKKPTLTKQLPATPCTPEMRAQVLALAHRLNMSLAEVIREGTKLYLAQHSQNLTVDVDAKEQITGRSLLPLMAPPHYP